MLNVVWGLLFQMRCHLSIEKAKKFDAKTRQGSPGDLFPHGLFSTLILPGIYLVWFKPAAEVFSRG